MTPYEMAQEVLVLLKDAIFRLVNESTIALAHAEIVKELDIPSNFEGTGKNYLSWSVLGLLVNDGRVHYRGRGRERIYYTRPEQLR